MMAEIAAAMRRCGTSSTRDVCRQHCAEPAQGTKTGTTRPADAKTDTASPSVDAAEPASVVAPKVKKTDGRLRLRARPAAAPPPDVPGRPTITVKDGTLSENADEAEKMLIAAGVPFYERSNELVRPITKIVDTFHGKKTTTVQLARVNTDLHARRSRQDRGLARATTPGGARSNGSTPRPNAQQRSSPAPASGISRRSAASSPRPRSGRTARSSTRPASMRQTRLLLVDPPAMPAIPDNPTREDAIAALKLLKDLLVEFPLVADVDKSVALSTLITPIARGGFPVAPLHATDAPDAGSGKSLLHDLAALIVTGQRMPVVAAGRDAEESEKRLGAALLAGQPLVCIDNISGALSGDALCQYIERHRPQVRVLGKSDVDHGRDRGRHLVRERQQSDHRRGPLPPRRARAPRRQDGAARVARVQGRPGAINHGRPRRLHRGGADDLPGIRGGGQAETRRSDSRRSRAGPTPSGRRSSGSTRSIRSCRWRHRARRTRSAAPSAISSATWADQFGTGEDQRQDAPGRGHARLRDDHQRRQLAADARPPEPPGRASGRGRRPEPARNLSASSLGYWLRSRKDAIAGPYCFRNKILSGEALWWVDALTAEAKRLSAAERLSSAANEQPQASGTATPGTAERQPPDDVAF